MNSALPSKSESEIGNMPVQEEPKSIGLGWIILIVIILLISFISAVARFFYHVSVFTWLFASTANDVKTVSNNLNALPKGTFQQLPPDNGGITWGR
jgi:hypothetical protein